MAIKNFNAEKLILSTLLNDGAPGKILSISSGGDLKTTAFSAFLASGITTLAGYGISDTKANFNSALSNGTFLYVGDVTSNVTTNLSFIRTATTLTVQSSDGTNAVLPEADTTNAGILGSDKWDEIVANSLKVSDVNHNVTTNLSFVRTATTVTVESSDGTNAILPEADTTNAGILGSDKWDEIVANSLKVSDVNHNTLTDLSLGTITATTMIVASSDGNDATLLQANTTEAGLLSAAKWNEIVANSLKVSDVNHNTLTNLTEGTATNTTVDVNSSDGDNATLLSASTSRAGLLTKAKWDEIVANSLKETNVVQTDLSGISDTKANFNTALSDGTFLYVGDVTTFPGWGSITDHTDIVSATNTNKFVLVSNGTTGYVGRALVEADISDFGSYLATGITTLSGYGISDSKANFNSALSDGTFLYVGDVTTFPGWGSITDHTDIVSATNTDKFVLVANGSTGYVGRALLEADISDLGSYLATGITTLSGYGISDSKANFNSALSDGTFLYVGDVTTFPGWGSITDHTDIVSATNTDKFVLVANGSTGYVGRALVEADISDLGSYLATGITTLSGYGISDSKANFNSALSDGTFLYVGDVTSNIPVATDVIWDAAGDLVVGTGADSAAKLAKGTALQQLRVNAGATALEWADAEGGGGANSADFELTATATAGDIVQLLSNGKMEPIAGTTSNLGSSFSFPDSEENGLKVDMDPFNANKFIAAWIDVDSDTRIAVGTITGQTITLGTPIDVPSPWTSIASLDIRWNPNVENEFAIVGREIFDELNVIGGTVSGTVPSISSNYNYAGSIDGICMDWVDDSHIVVIYKEGLDMTAKAFVIDGTNLPTLAATDGNVGGGLDFGNSTKAKMRTNPNTPGEFVMAFVDQSNSDIYALSGLFTAPSTLVAQDSAITLKGGTCDYPDISWHPTKTDTFLVSYDDGTSGYVLPCTISGGTITKYSEVVFFSSDSPSWNKIEHDPNDPDSFLIAYSYYDGTARQEMRLGTWTTDTVVTVAGSPLFTHEPSDTGYVSISYDKVLTTSKFIIAGSTSVGEAAVATYAGNNIDINARKGILQVSGVATDVREVLLSGIDETQTGMTIGTTYFVVDDGTLSPTPTSPIVPIGKAISATQLVVEQHPDGVQISDLHASLKDEFSISGTEIDWNRGITGFKTLGAAWSPTFANPVVGKTMMIVTTGNYTITWPTGVDAATDFADYDGTKRNVHIITCVSTSLPLYAGSVKAYTI